MSRYIYHYYIEINDGSKIKSIDGIAQCDKPITTMLDYKLLKLDAIALADQPNAESGKWIMKSLSFLGMENE